MDDSLSMKCAHFPFFEALLEIYWHFYCNFITNDSQITAGFCAFI